MKRRRFLQSSVAVAAVLGGCNTDDPSTETAPTSSPSRDLPSRSSTATRTDSAITARPGPDVDPVPASAIPDGIPGVPNGFDTVVDVTEIGGDPSGETPISHVLHEEVTDDTLLVFPSGSYRLGNIRVSGLQNVGLVSAPGATPTLVPSAPASELGPIWIRLEGVRGFLLDGLNLDFRADGHSGRLVVTGPGDFAVRNLRVLGHYDTPSAFRFDVRDPDSRAVIENLEAFGVDREVFTTTGIYVGRLHAGEITIRNCHLENFPDNGVYASPPGGHGGNFSSKGGRVIVEGGLYKNNNISNVRLGSTGSVARDVTIVVDEVPPRHPNGLNVRGVRLRGQHEQVIENCEIRFGSDAGQGFGAIRFNEDNGRATIRDTDIVVDRDGIPAISAAEPSAAAADGLSGPAGPKLENVRITGAASGESAVNIVGRNETAFHDCVIAQSGDDRHGITFEDSDDGLVSETEIDVTGTPIRLVRSTVERDRVSTMVPDDTNSSGENSPGGRAIQTSNPKDGRIVR